MTTIKKLIESINFNDKKIQTSPNWHVLGEFFGIDLYNSDDNRLKAYHVKTWYCTDTYVGWEAYFLDNEFVCLSNQIARKHTPEFEFLTKEHAIKLRDYLLTLVDQTDNLKIDILDIHQEIPDQFAVSYNTEILHKTGWYQNEKVEILNKNFRNEGMHSKNFFFTVEIKKSNGEKLMVDCRELLFDYNTLD